MFLSGATVWQRSDQCCGILIPGGEIYWIEFSKQPQFKKFKLEPGTFIWVYYLKEREKREITSIIPYEKDQKKEDLPQPESMEIEERPRWTRQAGDDD